MASSLAKLARIAIKETHAIHALLDRIQRFSHTVATVASQWRTKRSGEIPMSQEGELIVEGCVRGLADSEDGAVYHTLILQELTARVIQNAMFSGRQCRLPSPPKTPDGPVISSRILHTLHGLYFITFRMRPGSFSSYNFVHYAVMTSSPPTSTLNTRKHSSANRAQGSGTDPPAPRRPPP